ncbi:MAG: hypothetical protein C4517_16370, partial [Stygiobacter sp.]
VVIKNSETVETLSYYVYGSALPAVYGGAISFRAMAFCYFNNVLVGYKFMSTYDEDALDFDESKISQIKQGETTYDYVLKIMGDPNEMYQYPLSSDVNSREIRYSCSKNKEAMLNLLFTSKRLVITFNKSGIVTDMNYSSSGTK